MRHRKAQQHRFKAVLLSSLLTATAPWMPRPACAQSQRPAIASVQNGASFVRDYVSVGSIATITGTNLSSCTEEYRYPTMPTSMCNGTVSVRINGKEAPLFFVGHDLKDSQGNSFDQVNFYIPDDTSVGTANIEVRNATSSAQTSVNLKDAAPGIFVIPRFGDPRTPYAKRQGGFLAAQRYPDYTLLGLDNPARPADVLVVWGTGLGLPERTADGLRFNRTPDVYLNGKAVEVLYAVRSPQFAGVNQVAVKLPTDLNTGLHSLLLCYDSGTKCSQKVEVPFSAGNAWAGGWLEDLDRRPISSVPIAADSLDLGMSASSGAFIVPVQAGRQNEIKIRGMSANPRYYNWTANKPDYNDKLTWKIGFNPLRAVDPLNEPEISGDIQLWDYYEDPTVLRTYVPNASIRYDGHNADLFWPHVGKPRHVLENVRWMNSDLVKHGPCNCDKIYNWSKKTKLLFVNEQMAPAGYAAEVRRALRAINDGVGDIVFFEAANVSDADIYCDYSTQSSRFVETEFMDCVEVRKGRIYLRNVLPIRDDGRSSTVYESSLHELIHAGGLRAHSGEETDIMFWAYNGRRRLDQYDLKTLRILSKARNGTLTGKIDAQ